MTDDGAVHSARAKASASAEIEHQSNPSQVPEGPRSAKRYDGCRESLQNGKQVFFSPIFFGQESKKMGPPEAETGVRNIKRTRETDCHTSVRTGSQ